MTACVDPSGGSVRRWLAISSSADSCRADCRNPDPPDAGWVAPPAPRSRQRGARASRPCSSRPGAGVRSAG